MGEHHLGSLRLETAEVRAERIIGEELCRLGWEQADLVSRRKHDPGKVQIALRLRRETTLSVKQIAQRLHFDTPKSASFRLLTVMRSAPLPEPENDPQGTRDVLYRLQPYPLTDAPG